MIEFEITGTIPELEEQESQHRLGEISVQAQSIVEVLDAGVLFITQPMAYPFKI